MALITFDNGLRAVCTEKLDSKVASVVVSITGGCQSEKSNQSGISEYVARLLMFGTKNYPSREALSNYAKLNGIVLTPHVSRESLTLSALCPNDSIEQAVELLAEIIFNYTFDEISAKTVKKQLLLDIEKLSENHAYTLENSVNKALFYRTGLANPKFGTALTIERFDENVAREYMQKLVTPKNTIISVVGNIEAEEMEEYVAEYFEQRLPDDVDYKKIKFVSEVENYSGGLRTRNKRLNQSRISFAFPTVGYKNSKKHMPNILEPILLKKLNTALNLSDYFFTTEIKSKAYANNGKITFDVVVDYDYAKTHMLNFVRALKYILSEDGVTEEEFELEKNIYLTNFMRKHEDCLEQALSNTKEISILKRDFNIDSERLKIEMLTYKDANRFLEDTFNLNKMFVSYLGYNIDITFEDLLKA